ncbi:MAG: Na+/H+ antiporter subunit E [Planctomycetota bacterium]
MKAASTLFIVLFANWLLWSGHFDNPFLICLGGLSCLASLLIGLRMGIVDEEGAPAQLGLWPFITYAPWLAIEIVRSNFNVAKIILSRQMPLKRNLIRVPAQQRSELGRVMLANSITLTPGTVSVQLEGDQILVHGLSLDESADEIADDFGRRVCGLEQGKPLGAECQIASAQTNDSGNGDVEL